MVNQEIKPEKGKVLLGEKVVVNVNLRSLGHYKIKEIKSDSPFINIFEWKKKKNGIRLYAGFYNVGDLNVPVTILLEGKNIPDISETVNIKINVRKMISEDVFDIAPIKKIESVVSFNRNIVLFITFILAFLTVFLRDRKKRNIRRRTKKSPLEWCLNRLEEIKQMELLEQGRYKEYYDEISDCVRKYLNMKEGVSAIESTLFELQNFLKEKYSLRIYVSIREILAECDLIKFAPQGHEPNEIKDIWNKVYTLVKNEL